MYHESAEARTALEARHSRGPSRPTTREGATRAGSRAELPPDAQAQAGDAGVWEWGLPGFGGSSPRTAAVKAKAATAVQAAWRRFLVATAETRVAEGGEVLQTIEADRELLVRPIIESKRTVDETFRKSSAFADRVKELCKTKIGAAREARLAAQQALRLQAAEAAARGDSTAVLAAVQAIPDEVVTKGAGGGWAWAPEVVDSSIVPEAYKTVDLKKLQAYAKAFASSDTIPEVRGVVFKRVSRVIAGKR